MGVQRQLGESRALEIPLCREPDLAPVDVLKTSMKSISLSTVFLTQFKGCTGEPGDQQAEREHGRLRIIGFPGSKHSPVFDAAFAGESSGADGVPLQDYNDNF